MSIERADLSLARILAQRLAGPPLTDATAAVTHLGCVQAQDLPGALTSVALRTADRDRAGVRAALDAGELVRSWPMRGTLHLIAARDAGWMCELTSPRMYAQAAKRRAELGVTDAMLAHAGELAVAAITAEGPRTRAELIEMWQPHGYAEPSGRAYHLLMTLCHTGLLAQGPLRAGGKLEQCFVVLDDWVPEPVTPADREAALARWAERCFVSHGPATAADLARWTGLTMGDVRRGIAGASGLVTQEIDGVPHWYAAQLPDLLAEHRRAARGLLLLPGFDELILGYADRTPTLDRDHETLVVPGRNGVFKPTVITGGRAVGTWRRVKLKGVERIEATPFPGAKLPAEASLTRAFSRLPS
ncbi:winged helix DNA-binding protein [Propionibacteriaceae bacterium ES.041]|uniref:winged helix DNA-binding domain-containing protein n=1 Tax=Enemella evansiae TaxID=2016499 RepID=UPI000B9660E4|nr:winged helix DNA-binding domain-containing protein [Enemella evansiae]OYN95057.1 hypothetical protein CGZ96_16550 [Enemella evansiae]PFG66261.1 winged helix DNA-binding protein [Propionibacteriaceae bacterium ES.041]